MGPEKMGGLGHSLQPHQFITLCLHGLIHDREGPVPSRVAMTCGLAPTCCLWQGPCGLVLWNLRQQGDPSSTLNI